MGEVHRAFDTRMCDRPVALKLLSAELSADVVYRARFRRECELVALLREPHVVPIHEYGEIDGGLYLDMRLIARDGPFAPSRAVAVVEQVAAALDAAHGVHLCAGTAVRRRPPGAGQLPGQVPGHGGG